MKTIFLCLLMLATVAHSAPASADNGCPILLASAKNAYAEQVAKWRSQARATLKRNSEVVSQVRAFSAGLTPDDLALLTEAKEKAELREPALKLIELKLKNTMKDCTTGRSPVMVYANCPGEVTGQRILLSIGLNTPQIDLDIGFDWYSEPTTREGIQSFLRDLQLGTAQFPSFSTFAQDTIGVPPECFAPPKVPASNPVAASEIKEKGECRENAENVAKLKMQDVAQSAGAVK